MFNYIRTHLVCSTIKNLFVRQKRSKSETITVRVPKELKESLSKYEVEISKVVRRTLEGEVKRRKLEDLKGIADELGRFFAKIPRREDHRNHKGDTEVKVGVPPRPQRHSYNP